MMKILWLKLLIMFILRFNYYEEGMEKEERKESELERGKGKNFFLWKWAVGMQRCDDEVCIVECRVYSIQLSGIKRLLVKWLYFHCQVSSLWICTTSFAFFSFFRFLFIPFIPGNNFFSLFSISSLYIKLYISKKRKKVIFCLDKKWKNVCSSDIEKK